MFVRGAIVTPTVAKKKIKKVPTQPIQPAELSQDQAENYLLQFYKQNHLKAESLKQFVDRFEAENKENTNLKLIRDSIKKLKEQNKTDLIANVAQKLKQMDQEQLAILKDHLDLFYDCAIETPLSRVRGFKKKDHDDYVKSSLYPNNNKEPVLPVGSLDLCVSGNGRKHTQPSVLKMMRLHLQLQQILKKFSSKNLDDQAWKQLFIFNGQVKSLFENYKKLKKEQYTEMELEYQKIKTHIEKLEDAAQEIVLEKKAETSPPVAQQITAPLRPGKKHRRSREKEKAPQPAVSTSQRDKQLTGDVPQLAEVKNAAPVLAGTQKEVLSATQENLAAVTQPTQPITIDAKKEPEEQIQPPKMVNIKLTDGCVDLQDAITQTQDYLNSIIDIEIKNQKDHEINRLKLIDLKNQLGSTTLENLRFPTELPDSHNVKLIEACFKAYIALAQLKKTISSQLGSYIFTLPQYNRENPLTGFSDISRWAQDQNQRNSIPKVSPPVSLNNPSNEVKHAAAGTTLNTSSPARTQNSSQPMPVSSRNHTALQAHAESKTSSRSSVTTNQPSHPQEKIRWKGFTIGGLVTMVAGVVLFFTVPVVGQVLGSFLVVGTLGLTLGAGVGGAIEGSGEESQKPQESSNQPATQTMDGRVYQRLGASEEKTSTNVSSKNQNANAVKKPKNANELLTEFVAEIKKEIGKLDLTNQYIKEAYQANDMDTLIFSISIAPNYFNDNINIMKMKLVMIQEAMQSPNFSAQSKPRFIQAVIDARTRADFEAISRNINGKEKSNSKLFKFNESVGSLTDKLQAMADFSDQSQHDNSMQNGIV